MGFTRVERAFLALFKDPMAPIQNVTNASTIAGTSNASEDELISALATISDSTNHAPNEGSDAAENTMPPIDLLWNSLNAMNQANILTPRTNVTATAVIPNNAVSNSMESPASVFYEADAKDLPIETPMSHILEDFLQAHNEKDVLQKCLKQAKLNYTAEIESLRVEQAAQDKSMFETLN